MNVNVRNEYRPMLIERGERSDVVFKIQHDRKKRPGSDFRASREPSIVEHTLRTSSARSSAVANGIAQSSLTF